jgi:hypothetical protein
LANQKADFPGPRASIGSKLLAQTHLREAADQF